MAGLKKIVLVAGARPNFMKIAPILRVMEKGYTDSIRSILVHTGQHYDDNMSSGFFDSLGIRVPDYHLKVGSGSQADQTALIMSRFEDVCEQEHPDIVLVVGDVNSTIATGLVAKKMSIQLAHVEAGLRSRDRNMPEEINRLATDAITDIFFTTEKEANDNLLNEGHSRESIHFVGHVMIDNLYYQIDQLELQGPSIEILNLKRLLPKQYFCLTMHRPSNVDEPEVLTSLIKAIFDIAQNFPIVFPCHPRTRKQIKKLGLESLFDNPYGLNPGLKSGILLLEPLNYNDFLYLWKDCLAVLTDSGGLQEETTALQIPCLTLRDNTERPITLDLGSNILVGNDPDRLKSEVDKIIQGIKRENRIPELWDGLASERIVRILKNTLPS